jgi:hypothetical protein
MSLLSLTNKFVDIFAWVVDFQRLQKGDQFKLIYEENLVDENPIGIGRILGVYFEHSGSGYYAFLLIRAMAPIILMRMEIVCAKHS